MATSAPRGAHCPFHRGALLRASGSTSSSSLRLPRFNRLQLLTPATGPASATVKPASDYIGISTFRMSSAPPARRFRPRAPSGAGSVPTGIDRLITGRLRTDKLMSRRAVLSPEESAPGPRSRRASRDFIWTPKQHRRRQKMSRTCSGVGS